MSELKRDTFIYDGLGFPVRLINVPLKKVFNEWILDIDFNQFHLAVLLMLVKKRSRLRGKEVRFIRHYLELSTHAFAKLFGVTHTAILKWENEERKMGVGTEICIRLHVLDHLKVTDKEFRKIYLTFTPEVITKKPSQNIPLDIEVDKIAC